MNGQPEKRMADNYEITQAIPIGDKEVVMGMDETNAMPYFCAFYSKNGICGSYSDCMVSDDYVEIMEIFSERVREQCEKVREEQEKITVPMEPITADMCLSLAYDTSLVGKVAAVRLDALKPEYRSAPDQLVYVTGGKLVEVPVYAQIFTVENQADGKGRICRGRSDRSFCRTGQRYGRKRYRKKSRTGRCGE